MHLKFRIKLYYSIWYVQGGTWDRQILHLSYCLKSKISVFREKKKKKKKKKKPLDPDHVHDTIRSFLGIQTHPLFSTCARTNASFLHIMSIQTTKNTIKVFKKILRWNEFNTYTCYSIPSFYHTMLTSACRGKSLSRWCQNTLQRLLA